MRARRNNVRTGRTFAAGDALSSFTTVFAYRRHRRTNRKCWCVLEYSSSFGLLALMLGRHYSDYEASLDVLGIQDHSISVTVPALPIAPAALALLDVPFPPLVHVVNPVLGGLICLKAPFPALMHVANPPLWSLVRLNPMRFPPFPNREMMLLYL